MEVTGFFSLFCSETKLKLETFVRPTSNYGQLLFVPEFSCEKYSEKIFPVRLIFGGDKGRIGGGGGGGGKLTNRSVDTATEKIKMPPDCGLGSQSQR